jgi:FtsH-binding integral membrane protein
MIVLLRVVAFHLIYLGVGCLLVALIAFLDPGWPRRHRRVVPIVVVLWPMMLGVMVWAILVPGRGGDDE